MLDSPWDTKQNEYALRNQTKGKVKTFFREFLKLNFCILLVLSKHQSDTRYMQAVWKVVVVAAASHSRYIVSRGDEKVNLRDDI